jgi:hypothetical protein
MGGRTPAGIRARRQIAGNEVRLELIEGRPDPIENGVSVSEAGQGEAQEQGDGDREQGRRNSAQIGENGPSLRWGW